MTEEPVPALDVERLGLALREGEDRFRDLVNALHVGVLIQGPRSEVLFANAAAERLLGLAGAQIIGKTSVDATPFALRGDGTAFPGQDHPGPQALATGKPVRDVVMGFKRPATGDCVWLLVNADPHRGADGAVDYVVSTFSDITSGREVTERLRESERRYRQLVERAPDIIYRTDIRGFFTYVNPAASRVMEYVDNELVGKHYLELVRDDHRARVEAMLVDQFHRRVPSTHAEFVAVTKSGREVWIAQNVELLVEGGRVQGFQAVARDVTERRTVQEALEKVSRLKDEFVASVSHELREPLTEVIAAAQRLTGTWLSEEQRIQVEAIAGSGRKLLDMIDDIRAFSEPEGDARPASAGAARPSPEGAGRRVLVVEDDPVNRKVVSAMLQGLGYAVNIVVNGREAVEACRTARFDLVFMDCQMPEMDGLAATEAIRRQQGSGRRIPIVAMTANAAPGYEARCRAAGMDDFLPKPVPLQVLRATVRRWAGPTASAQSPDKPKP